MLRAPHLAACVVLLVSSLSPAVAAPQDAAAPVEKLADALAAAKKGDERTSLLDANPSLVTPDLVRALNERGEGLGGGKSEVALAAFEAAEEVATRIGDRRGLARALHGMGGVYTGLGESRPAIELSNRALEIRETLGDKTEIADTLGNLGASYTDAGEFDKALECHTRALALREAVGDKAKIAASLNDIGRTHFHRGDVRAAGDYFGRALAQFEALGDKPRIAAGLSNVANVLSRQGDHDRALEYLARSIALCEELGNKRLLAIGLVNTGSNHFDKGDFRLALVAYERALALAEEIGNKFIAARALASVAGVYRKHGDYDLALEYYGRALALAEATGDKTQVGSMLDEIGNVYFFQGDHDRAIEQLERSLKLREEIGNGDLIAVVLGDMGDVYAGRGDTARALERYEKALALFEAAEDAEGITETLGDMGRVYERLGDHARAAGLAERKAEIARKTGERDALWAAHTLAGRAYSGLGRREDARRAFEEAIAIVESLRSDVAGGAESQQGLFESRVAPYYEIVATLVAENKPEEALAYAERAKGRALLDVLSGGHADVTKSMTAAERVRERALRDAIASLNSQVAAERERETPDAARVADLEARLEKARLEHAAFQTSLYAAHPELRAKRGEAPPLGARDVASLLPGAAGALLEYVVYEDRTYLFAVTRDGGAAAVKAYALGLSARDVATRVERFRGKLATRDLDFAADARALYDVLLGPARAQLAGKTALVIVPDGALWELPFQALQPAPGRYVVEERAVSYAPSLTVLAEMAKGAGPKKAFGAETLLALGNPALGTAPAKRAGSALMGDELVPLPEAERQVVALGRLYGAARSAVYVGAGATEARVKADAAKYRILHLATHGLLDDASPMYSRVVLAPGGPGEDGLLEAWEIKNLDLDADLVVLSACETGRGRVGAGEGVVGLTWALFVAGCPRAVVSQWKVDAASTTELMVGLHRNLTTGAPDRVSVAEALRRASLALLRTESYRHPFYWAGFVPVGDGFWPRRAGAGHGGD